MFLNFTILALKYSIKSKLKIKEDAFIFKNYFKIIANS